MDLIRGRWCTHGFLRTTATILIFGLIYQILGIIEKRMWPNKVQERLVCPVERTAEKSCQPKTNVMFLKTHKTASSTILNILYRFGEAKNLTFALPVFYQFGYPFPFNARTIKHYDPHSTQRYNIICNHMRFYQPEVEKVMPDGTFYFSILRNPVTLSESAFSYYKSTSPAFQQVDSLEQFLSDPWKYYSASSQNNHYARNIMWFDFGYDHNANESMEYVDLVMREIGRTFHLVLISEYFDESMILLKDALCWELDDVVSFKLNIRSHESVRRLSDRATRHARSWNALDWRLYSHFNKTFWRKADGYGRRRMESDVLLLQKACARAADLCLQGRGPIDGGEIRDSRLKPFQYGRAKIMSYNLNPGLNYSAREKCSHMVMPELQYKYLLDAKLFP